MTWAASVRAETGLILTNGCFTSKAQKEANRDGVPPIELIDGERLVSLFEKYELGLKPKTVYELVPEFPLKRDETSSGVLRVRPRYQFAPVMARGGLRGARAPR